MNSKTWSRIGRRKTDASWCKHLRRAWKRFAHKASRQAAKREAWADLAT